jgi:hypothetical protein
MRVLLVLALCTAPLAAADEAPPTKEQLDAAKTAFAEADVLYKAGKVAESIDKLKESYRLSRNVFITYNIGHAYDQAGDKPKALGFYLKFIENAPANAPRIAEATQRVDALQKEGVNPDLAATEISTSEVVAPSKYSHADFKHRLIETTPPGKPVTILAEIPADSGWVVTLHYRGPQDENYTPVPMAPQGSQLVGVIPAAKVALGSLHYYVEVKDDQDKLVTRSGRRTSPNLVKVEDVAVVLGPRSDDPLLRVVPPAREPIQIFTPRNVSTTAAVLLIGGSITTYLIAQQKSEDLIFDTTECGTPPCRPFDEFDRKLAEDGKRYNRIYQVTLGVTVAAVGVAGYFWFRSLTTKRDKVSTSKAVAPSWAFAPAVGGEYSGAAAARSF